MVFWTRLLSRRLDIGWIRTRANEVFANHVVELLSTGSSSQTVAMCLMVPLRHVEEAPGAVPALALGYPWV